jgi:hypothetical protein
MSTRVIENSATLGVGSRTMDNFGGRPIEPRDLCEPFKSHGKW